MPFGRALGLVGSAFDYFGARSLNRQQQSLGMQSFYGQQDYYRSQGATIQEILGG